MKTKLKKITLNLLDNNSYTSFMRFVGKIKQLVFTGVLSSILFVSSATASTTSLELGFGFYVGGFHIMDAKTTLQTTDNTYKYTAYASTRGVTDWIAGFVGISTSKGILNKDGSIKARLHTNTSYSNFGENYSVLKLTDSGATLTRYPDRNEENLQNLANNPLIKANDPIATLINIMVQVGDTDKCAKDLIVVANHFLYRMKTKKSSNGNINEPNYNVVSGKTTTCELDFVRLDKEQNFVAYNELGGNGDGKDRPPIAHFKKIKGIPYALPVLVNAKEKIFGEFRMHLQYVKYNDISHTAKAWKGEQSLTQDKLNLLKNIPKLLGAE